MELTPARLGNGLAVGAAAALLARDLDLPTLLSYRGDRSPLVIAAAGVLALLAGLFYGAFFLATERARDNLSSLVTWWVAAVSSAVALLAFSLILRQPLWGYSPTTYASLIALALVTQVGGYIAINYALGHLPASVVSPTLLGQPVLTALLAVPLLGEALTAAQIVGGLAVLAGIAIVHRAKENHAA